MFGVGSKSMNSFYVLFEVSGESPTEFMQQVCMNFQPTKDSFFQIDNSTSRPLFEAHLTCKMTAAALC